MNVLNVTEQDMLRRKELYNVEGIVKRETIRMEYKVSEKEFRQQILDLAKLFGWHCYFTWNSIHSPAGFLDLVLVRKPWCLFVELKAEKGKLSPKQEEWLGELSCCTGIRVCIWRPSQFDEIVKILKGGVK